MSEPEELIEFKATPEEIQNNRRQVWLVLLVMIASSGVGVVVLTVILWLLLKNGLPPGLS